jgi:threonine aldolase
MKISRQFASDNCSGICPEAWAAMAEANAGHDAAYGNDLWTQRAADAIREIFETDCDVFFVFGGTAANSLALAQLCPSYHSILCHELSHLETSECGGPEFFSGGSKVRALRGANGKIDLAEIERVADKPFNLHYAKPRVLSFTQPTEVGTIYSVAEIQALIETARKFDLRVHMDGARFANAIASLKISPAEMTWRAGVDALCFGGTKNGLAFGEAIIFFNRELAREFDYRAKQGGQLASKMRFLSAPWLGVLRDGAWLRHARHANEMAQRMAAGLEKIPEIKISFPVQSNAVFARIPKAAEEKVRARGWQFSTGNVTPDSRLMCSWDTTPDDVDNFISDLKNAI